MNSQTAFIGDIHGNISALENIVRLLDANGSVEQIVFLGDYVNRGSQSKEVLHYLITLSKQRPSVHCLSGNHEKQFLRALGTDDHMPKFLKMGGAETIRSYLGDHAPPTVGAALRKHVPASHVQFLNELSEVYEADSVIAKHRPFESAQPKFTVTGHRYVGDEPQIDASGAQIDTGCTGASGRLTAFLWPSRQYLQVSAVGSEVTPATGAES